MESSSFQHVFMDPVGDYLPFRLTQKRELNFVKIIQYIYICIKLKLLSKVLFGLTRTKQEKVTCS